MIELSKDKEQLEEDMSIVSACEYVGRTPSGYHKHQKRKDQPPKKKGRPATGEVDEEMTNVIAWIRRCWAPKQVGYRYITAILNRTEYDVSRTFLNETLSLIFGDHRQ